MNHFFKHGRLGRYNAMKRRRGVLSRRSNSGLEALEPRVVLSVSPIISEIVASNDTTLVDQDGDDTDWIEIYNPGNETLSLDNYLLTDDANDLKKWRLPDVELDGGSYMIVFASGKDRDNPSDELHTNFRLSRQGSYLALVEPDGQTIVSSFGEDGFPEQIEDVSYGVPVGIETQPLVVTGDVAQYIVPTDNSVDPVEPDAVGGSWLDPSFDDAGWKSGATGLGYVPPQEIVQLADSVAEFSGVQEQDNWEYGTWAKNADTDKIYAASEFVPLNAGAFFDAANNQWDQGSPPNLRIGPSVSHPSTVNAGFLTQWAIRRWRSETAGEVTIAGTIDNPDAAGDGTVARIIHNGTEVLNRTVNGASEDYSITINVALGDTVDFAIDAGDVDNEVGDATSFTATIHGFEFNPTPITVVADSEEDWPDSEIQGIDGWSFGYYQPLLDLDRAYQANNMVEFPSEFYTGRKWDIPGGATLTEISQRSARASGVEDGGEAEWSVRRWTSDYSGRVDIEWSFSKSRSGGDGATGRVFLNGEEIDSIQVEGDDRTGQTKTVSVPDIKVGDYLDFVVDPLGPSGDPNAPDGNNDLVSFSATVTRFANIEEAFTTDIRSDAFDVGSSVYLRMPFSIEDPTVVTELDLNLMYEDGFIAYINGQPVASSNIPEDIGFNSVAVEARDAIPATEFESFDIAHGIEFLTVGNNILQIHVMNTSANDRDLLVVPELSAGVQKVEADQSRFFLTPTPGGPNGLGAAKLGPLLTDVDHLPNVPTPGEAIVVTAAVDPTFADVAELRLNYVVMFGDTITLAMVDDGSGDDAAALDGIYTATIPADVAAPGEMVRWFVSATDVEGRPSKYPPNRDPSDSEKYLGTIVEDASIESNLPVFHMFIENPRRADSDAGSKASLFYDGEFYDNVQFDLHGQSSRGFPIKSYDVDFPKDHRFLLDEDAGRMKDFNLLSNYADQSLLRNTLAWEMHNLSGSPSLLAFPVRLQQNGEFRAIYDFVEDGDDRWLDRVGLDPEGALYKIYDTWSSVGSAEKKSRKFEGKDDLDAAIRGVRNNADDPIGYIFDNYDLPDMVNYMVGMSLVSDRDCCHKNYYAYRDTNGTEDWSFLQWDEDLTFGHNWGGFGRAYFDDTIYFDNGLIRGDNNTLLSSLYNRVPGVREMFMRRMRTVMDQLIQPPGTPYEDLYFETRVDELVEMMAPDAALHNAQNRAPWGQNGHRDFAEGTDILKNDYAGPRRDFLYNTQTVSDDSSFTEFFSSEPGETPVSYFIPTDDSLGTSWTELGFDDAAWATGTTGLGYETSGDNYAPLLGTNIEEAIAGKEASLFARIPFTLDSVDDIEALTLRMKYDDGFVAYLNGVEVARDRVPDGDVAFNARASRSHADRQAVVFSNFAITEHIDKLNVGENVLAIQGLYRQQADNDMLILPALGSGIVVGSRGEVPLAQIGNPKIDFGDIENQPSSGNQAEEYVQLTNENQAAVDISGWKISSGEMEMTFKAGTVIPAGSSMYVAANKPAFKARAEGPTGGQHLYVIGNYDGNLSNGGGTITLTAVDGEVVSAKEFTGEVSEVQGALVVSEINYNPQNPSAAELAQNVALDPEDFEFVEVQNISDSEVSLDGVKFANGIEFDFTGGNVQSLTAGERVLVVKDLAAFTLRYGADAADRVAGEFAPGTGLGNAGERIELLDAGNSIVADFRYETDADTGWAARADGRGSTLELIDPTADPNDGLSWIASTRVGGTPGSREDAGSFVRPSVVINEVLANSDDPVTDTIELLNLSSTRLTMEHFYLSDGAATSDSLARYSIPTTTIDPVSYLLLDESDFNAGDNGFAFSSNGETIYLTVGDANGPTHFVDTVSFGATAAGETYGRIPGSDMFAPMLESTLGGFNSDARVGPVVITEIQRDAGEPSDAALAIYPNLDGGDLEFVEIYNPQQTTVVLNNWRIRGGVDINFDGEMLGSGEALVVVSFAADREDNAARTSAFRTHYGLSDEVRIVGGYANQLNNDRDRVTLQRPGAPAGDGAIPRLLEDQVVYSDTGAWQSESGNSLQRVSAGAYGNDPLNWVSLPPTPGTTGFAEADMNGDGSITSDDIQVVCSGIAAQDAMEYDFTRDGQLSFADLDYFVRRVVGTTFGDSNVDGTFDSTDLTLVFQAGQYEDATPGNSVWATGDWNCDGDFTTRDFVTAFMYGSYDGGALAVRSAANDSAVNVAGALHASSDDLSGPEDAPVSRIAQGDSARSLGDTNSTQLEGQLVDSIFSESRSDSQLERPSDRDNFGDDDWQADLI